MIIVTMVIQHFLSFFFKFKFCNALVVEGKANEI